MAPLMGVDSAPPSADRTASEKGGEWHHATISYAVEAAGRELTQMLNVIFGNSSMKDGVRVEHIELSPAVLGWLGGPRFGREGVRKLLDAYDRPLFCSAVKPI